MKMRTFLLTMFMLAASSVVMGGGMQYELRVDGLACPFCAYGIEKKLKKTAGVKTVAFDLEAGKVIVTTEESARFTEDEMERLIEEAGFTLRGMTERELP